MTINTSTALHANVSARISRNVELDNITIMTHVNASVKIHQLANIHTITIPTLVNVIADLMTAMLANTLTQRAVAASAQSTRPAQTINTSTALHANVSAVM